MTEILVSPEQFNITNRWQGARYRRAYRRGRWLGEQSEFWDRYRAWEAKKQRGPLTPEQVIEQVAIQEADEINTEARTKEMDVVTEITAESAKTLGSRYAFAYRLQEFLKAHPHIKSVANIGARVDFYSAYLAPRFSDMQFRSVDFQTRLKQHNRLLPQSPNWTFHPGYWLDLMRAGFRADMYFAVSTTVLMNNVELNTFLDEISRHATAFACCEGWFPKANTLRSRIVPPEDVPEENPYCSGDYANYHHNYVRKLERRGFKVSASIVPKELSFHYLQLFAVKQ